MRVVIPSLPQRELPFSPGLNENGPSCQSFRKLHQAGKFRNEVTGSLCVLFKVKAQVFLRLAFSNITVVHKQQHFNPNSLKACLLCISVGSRSERFHMFHACAAESTVLNPLLIDGMKGVFCYFLLVFGALLQQHTELLKFSGLWFGSQVKCHTANLLIT